MDCFDTFARVETRSDDLEKAMKTSLYCLAIALLFRLALAVTDERINENSEPRDISLVDHLHGHWLTVGRINHKEPGGEFDPNWTYIKTG